MTEPNISKLILGPSATEDLALNERNADVAEAKDWKPPRCSRCRDELEEDSAISIGFCEKCEE